MTEESFLFGVFLEAIEGFLAGDFFDAEDWVFLVGFKDI